MWRAAAGGKTAEEAVHRHKICGDPDCDDPEVDWTPWSSTDSLPDEAGNYYLTGDVTLHETWKPEGETALCLNGYTIRQEEAEYSAIKIESGQIFSLSDCKQEGRIISKSQNILNYPDAEFHMYGGNITKEGGEGKGCGVLNGGWFVMYNGKITNNKSIFGGGVENIGTFSMLGGEISKNESSFTGGGVDSSTGQFYMYGGAICNNKAQTGGGLSAGEEMHIGCRVQIRDNTGADGAASNVLLGRDGGMTIDKPLEEGSYIGVTTSKIPIEGKPVAVTGPNETADYQKYFHCDQQEYFITGGADNAVQIYAEAPLKDIDTIATVEDLENFRTIVNGGHDFAGRTVTLTADIDLSEKYGPDINGEEVSWTPIGEEQYFSGIFDGQNHTIKGLYMHISGEPPMSAGLFGTVGEEGILKDLTVDGTVISDTGGLYIGGIAGACYGKITGCRNDAGITVAAETATWTGGIAGLCVEASGCRNTGDIRMKAGKIKRKLCAGGIAGEIISADSCYNAGNIESEGGGAVGGIAGEIGSRSKIERPGIYNCYNKGYISGEAAGGICGSAEEGMQIENCYTIGKAESTEGGICGPILAENEGTQVSGCYYLDSIYEGEEPEGAAAVSREALAKTETFAGWDFKNVWAMRRAEGDVRPVLTAAMEEEPAPVPGPDPNPDPNPNPLPEPLPNPGEGGASGQMSAADLSPGQSPAGNSGANAPGGAGQKNPAIGRNPKTGDSESRFFWSLVCVLAGTGCIITIRIRDRKARRMI